MGTGDCNTASTTARKYSDIDSRNGIVLPWRGILMYIAKASTSKTEISRPLTYPGHWAHEIAAIYRWNSPSPKGKKPTSIQILGISRGLRRNHSARGITAASMIMRKTHFTDHSSFSNHEDSSLKSTTRLERDQR